MWYMWDCSSAVKHEANSSFNVDEHWMHFLYPIHAEAVETNFGALTSLSETGISNFRVTFYQLQLQAKIEPFLT